MITDDELLAACRAAGEPGMESHRLACRVYRRAAAEWQARDLAWRRDRAAMVERVIGEKLREAASAAWLAVMIRRGLGGR